MRTIVGTDFSEKAAAAGRAAAALARRWGDTLIVATSLDNFLNRRLPQDVNETLTSFVTDNLHNEAGNLATGGLPIEERMLSGHPDIALADLARREQARLTVVGSLGLRDGGWRLGSVADRLAEQGPCPTLVVRSSEPFEVWAKEEKPLKVFVAFDFTEVAEQALLWVKNLQAAGPCEIVVGYVDWPLADESRLGLWWPPLQPHNPPRVQAILERELRSRAVKLLDQTNVTVRCEPSMGQPDARLIEMARSEQADLIVTGTHQYDALGRLWHHSVSRALLHHAPMNVLCVPGTHKEPAPIQRVAVNRVLAAVDLSDQGGGAVPLAYGIARSGGVVRLLHVATPFETQGSLVAGYPYPVPASKEKHAKILAEIRKQLNAMIPPDALASGISTEVAVLEARDVAQTIRQEGERFGADVICVGAHNRSAIPRLTLGSVAQAVATRSTRPVLMVHHTPQ